MNIEDKIDKHLDEVIQKSQHKVDDDVTKASIIKQYQQMAYTVKQKGTDLDLMINLLKKGDLTPEEWGVFQSMINIINRQIGSLFGPEKGTLWAKQLKDTLKDKNVRMS